MLPSDSDLGWLCEGKTMSDNRDPQITGRRKVVGWLLVLVSFLGVVAASLAPARYVIHSPGAVINVFGSLDDKPIISIKGATTYKTSGELDVLTVYVRGEPGNLPTWAEVIAAYFNSDQVLTPYDEVYAPDENKSQHDSQVSKMMLDSQRDAIAVALKKSGYVVKSWLAVDVVGTGRPADGLIKPDDILLSVNSIEPKSLQDVVEQIEDSDGKPVEFQIIRNGKPKTISVTPVMDPQVGAYRVGMQLGFRYDFPIDVKVDLGDVTGPSAGLTFTLGIIDTLDAGSLTSGNKVASTGTIGADGSVGAIGGVQLKMKAALDSGAKFMLAPLGNCNEIVGHVPAGLQVVAVKNIDEALAALEQLRVQKKPPTSTKLGCPIR